MPCVFVYKGVILIDILNLWRVYYILWVSNNKMLAYTQIVRTSYWLFKSHYVSIFVENIYIIFSPLKVMPPLRGHFKRHTILNATSRGRNAPILIKKKRLRINTIIRDNKSLLKLVNCINYVKFCEVSYSDLSSPKLYCQKKK